MLVDVLIFSAGLGTRLSPLTDNKPKALVEFDGIPLLGHALNKLDNCPVSTVYINVHHFSEQVIAYIESVQDDYAFKITISDETELVLETGGAIKKIVDVIDNPLLAFNVDVLFDLDLVRFLGLFAASGSDAFLAVKDRSTSRYLAFADSLLAGWTNIATGEVKGNVTEESKLFAFSGIQVLSKNILQEISKYEKRKFSIIDFYLSICMKYRIEAYAETYQWMDVGRYEKIGDAEAFFHSLKLQGVY